MKTNIDKGRIVKALAGFYYIDDGHEVHQCRARGKFRKQDIKPVVGDFVEFQKGALRAAVGRGAKSGAGDR